MGLNKLIFGGLDTSDYGIAITGSGTFSAPERDVDFIEVPGRNGDLSIDNGRYKNIEVTYPANIPRQFAAKFGNFRADISRKRGYQRLEDTYHPDEYRQGVLVEGLNPDVTALNRGGQFDLKFNCKPQRFLKSGDMPITLLPPVILLNVYASQYIPHIAGETIEVTTYCPDSDRIDLTVRYYDTADPATVLQSEIKTAYNGETVTFTQPTLSAENAAWRLVIAGYSDRDTIKFKIKTNTTYEGNPLAIDAWMTTHLELTNPTGFPTYPLFEVYGSIFPEVDLTNTVDGVRDSWFFFRSSQTSGAHIYLDCDLQYLYTDTGVNVTDKFILSNQGSVGGEGFIFPVFGGGTISLTDLSYSYPSIGYGIGLLNIYPRWWRI